MMVAAWVAVARVVPVVVTGVGAVEAWVVAGDSEVLGWAATVATVALGVG